MDNLFASQELGQLFNICSRPKHAFQQYFDADTLSLTLLSLTLLLLTLLSLTLLSLTLLWLMLLSQTPLPLTPLPLTPMPLMPLSLTPPACLYAVGLHHHLLLRPWPAFFIFILPVSSLLSSLLSIPCSSVTSISLFICDWISSF
jgi:hypothetical protein